MVPLMMPSTRRIGSPWRLSRRARMIGMPPATAASNSRSDPAASAAAYSSAPTLASSSLFAVTTGLPAASAVEDQLAGRFDAADHLDDEVDVGIVDDAVGIAGEHASATSTSRSGRQVAHGDPGDLQPDAGALLDGAPAAPGRVDERTADVAAAEQTDPDHAVRPDLAVRHGTQATGPPPSVPIPVPAEPISCVGYFVSSGVSWGVGARNTRLGPRGPVVIVRWRCGGGPAARSGGCRGAGACASRPIRRGAPSPRRRRRAARRQRRSRRPTPHRSPSATASAAARTAAGPTRTRAGVPSGSAPNVNTRT